MFNDIDQGVDELIFINLKSWLICASDDVSVIA